MIRPRRTWIAPGRTPRGVTTRRLRITRSGRNTSEAQQIQLDLFIPALLRPRVQRRRGDFVDERDGEAEAAEIDAFQVALAGVADLDAHVLQVRPRKITELPLVVLAAGRTDNTSKWPRCETSRAHEKPAASVPARC